MLCVTWCLCLMLVRAWARPDAELVCHQRRPSESFHLHLDNSSLLEDAVNVSFSASSLVSVHLSALPAAFCLDLSANQLHEWPFLAQQLPSAVKYLNLSRNLIGDWNLDLMGNFENVRILDLSENRLGELKLPALLRLSSLEVLFLHGNPMNVFGELKYIPSLQTVVLSQEHWYAINNIDFGPHPVNLLMNTSLEAAALRFRCTERRSASQVLNVDGCREVAVSDHLTPRGVCVVCYQCFQRDASDGDKDFQSTLLSSQECHCTLWILSSSVGAVVSLALCVISAYLFMSNRSRRSLRNRNSFEEENFFPRNATSSDRKQDRRLPYYLSNASNSPISLLKTRKFYSERNLGAPFTDLSIYYAEDTV